MVNFEIMDYIERLRKNKNITQDEFIDGIVSKRQYQRYMNGECPIPFDKLNLMVDKLNTSLLNLMIIFNNEKINENRIFSEVFNAVKNKDSKSYDLINKYRNYNFLADDNKILYDSAIVLNQYYHNIIKKKHALVLLKDIIDFNKILKSKNISDNQIFLLGIIFYLEDDKKELLEIFDNIYLNNKDIIINKNNFYTHIQVMQYLSLYYFDERLYDNCLKYCDIGLYYLDIYKSYYCLDYFYYLKACISYYENKTSDFKDYYNKTLAVALLNNKTDIFKKLFNDNLRKIKK